MTNKSDKKCMVVFGVRTRGVPHDTETVDTNMRSLKVQEDNDESGTTCF